MVAETATYGGRTATNALVQGVEATWNFHRDKNGFTAQLFDAEFASADAALRGVFGPPYGSRIQSSEEGPRYSMWASKDIGVAIQFIDLTNHIEVSRVRGMPGLGTMMDEAAKPWWKKIRLW
jgi:hypothetical protein